MLLTLPSLAGVAALKSLITLYINICKITFFPSTQFAYIYMLAYLYVCCVTRINLVILHIFMYNVISDLDNIYMHIYRMSPYSTGCNYDKGQSVKGEHVVFYLVFN